MPYSLFETDLGVTLVDIATDIYNDLSPVSVLDFERMVQDALPDNVREGEDTFALAEVAVTAYITTNPTPELSQMVVDHCHRLGKVVIVEWSARIVNAYEWLHE